MLTCQQALFNLEENITYLNTAYMSPLLKSVVESGIKGIRKKERPYLFKDEDFFSEPREVRNIYSKIIDNPEPERIALIPSASYGLENAARNIPFKKGDEIIIVSDQFPSNVYPWMAIAGVKNLKLITIPSPGEHPKKSTLWNQAILNQINKKTKAVVLPHVHWSEGIVFDLAQIRLATNEVNAYLIIDGTQSVGAFPFSIQEFRPDALICSTYKWLMGPYGIGLAYYGPEFDQGRPIENNWINRLHSEDFSQLVNYQTQYKSGAARYSAGEHSNFILLPMLQKALKKILDWSPENIQTYCGSILHPLDLLLEAGFAIPTENQRSNHLIGIKIPDRIDPKQLKNRLKDYDVIVSVRNKHLRVSPYVFNRMDDLAKLVDITLSLE